MWFFYCPFSVAKAVSDGVPLPVFVSCFGSQISLHTSYSVYLGIFELNSNFQRSSSKHLRFDRLVKILSTIHKSCTGTTRSSSLFLSRICSIGGFACRPYLPSWVLCDSNRRRSTLCAGIVIFEMPLYISTSSIYTIPVLFIMTCLPSFMNRVHSSVSSSLLTFSSNHFLLLISALVRYLLLERNLIQHILFRGIDQSVFIECLIPCHSSS